MPRKAVLVASNANPQVESLEPRTLLSTGALDPSFGTGGLATFSQFSGANHLRTEPDGKLLATTAEGLIRFNADGSLDTGFGTNGVANAGFSPVDVAVAPDGKLVVAGTVARRYAVARFNTDGSPDTTFGTGGVSTARHLPRHTLTAFDLVVQSDGKVLVGGSETNPYTPFPKAPIPQVVSATVMHFNTDGTLDTSYGTGGAADAGDGYGMTAMALAPDGSMIATLHLYQIGQEPTSILASVDSTGQHVTPFTDARSSNTTYGNLAIDASGKPVVWRAIFGSNNIERFAGASTDTSFGNGGYVASGENFIGMTPEADGTYLVAATDPIGRMTFRHYLADGTLDTTFGGIGAVAPALGPDPSRLSFFGGMPALLNDGNVVVPGSDAQKHLVLAKVQVNDAEGATNPTATGVTFTPPAAGGRWAYATVTFAPDSADLDPASALAHGLVVDVLDGAGNFQTEITGNLVSTAGGGNGAPVTVTYAFRIGGRTGLSRADSGTYQFAVVAGAISDVQGRGSVGAIAGAYTLYLARGRHRTPVVTPTAVNAKPLFL